MHCGWIQRNRECIGQYICKYFFIAFKHITFISYAIYNISNNYYKEYSVCVNLLLKDYGFLFSIPILHAFNVNIVDLKERILLLHIDNKRIWHKFNWRHENCFFDRLSDWLLWRKLVRDQADIQIWERLQTPLFSWWGGSVQIGVWLPDTWCNNEHRYTRATWIWV